MKRLVQASQRPWPEDYPVLGGIYDRRDGVPQRTVPGALLDNDHAEKLHGYGLATLAERGGLHVVEVAANMERMSHDEAMALTVERAERIVEARMRQHAQEKRP